MRAKLKAKLGESMSKIGKGKGGSKRQGERFGAWLQL